MYAASFLRQRKIILERALLRNRGTFRLILIHELFHFVWPRLGNGSRKSFEAVLLEESRRGARGDLGESSGVTKELLPRSSANEKPGPWRDYVCECFCDTAAWFYTRREADDLFSLAKRWKDRRKAWFDAMADRPWKC